MQSKVVLITGCSTGIGRDMCERLTQSGYMVVATARNLNAIDDLDAALKLALDVTVSESVTDAVNKVIQQFGRIDVLINNAGYAIRGAVEELPDDRIHQMFNVNVYGVIRMIHAVAPHMRKQGSGRIINIGSIAGKIVLPVNGSYSATKFAIEGLSDALRLEMAPFGIHVVLVEPGNFRSNFVNTVQSNSGEVLSNEKSAYFELYKQYISVNTKFREKESGPEAITRVVKRAAEATKPKARYRAAVPTVYYLLTFLGDGIKDFVFRKLFKIKFLS